MQCRHFTIRPTPEHAREDEARLNAFLSAVQVYAVQASAGMLPDGRWSVLVFYEPRSAPSSWKGVGGVPLTRLIA